MERQSNLPVVIFWCGVGKQHGVVAAFKPPICDRLVSQIYVVGKCCLRSGKTTCVYSHISSLFIDCQIKIYKQRGGITHTHTFVVFLGGLVVNFFTI